MILVKLSEILGRKKLKISKVITDTGVTRPTLTSLYYGNSKGINFDTLNSLCKYLSITPGDILKFYDVDIRNVTVIFDRNITIDDITIDEDGNSMEIIDRADFKGTLEYENSQMADLTFKGYLSHARSEPHTNFYSLTLDFDLLREEYMRIPDDIQQVIENEIIDTILGEFSEFDCTAEISDEYFTFSDQ